MLFAALPGLIIHSNIYAQSPEIQWQNTIGGSSYDYLVATLPTADGGYITGGSSASGITGDKTENYVGVYDYWVVKTDASGNIQWQNTIGGSLEDMLKSIQQTSDGGYILCGKSKSGISGDKTENTNGGYDYWIVKLDGSGAIQWQQTIGGDLDDKDPVIRQTSDGGYILGGLSVSGISGDKTEDVIGNTDFWVMKLSTTGEILWQNTIGGSTDDLLTSVLQTSDGGYIVAGTSDSDISGDKTENSNGNADYWIVKLNPSGDIQWQQTIGGSDIDWLYSLQQTSDNGFIACGNSYSNISGDKTENSNGDADYWVIKMNNTGAIEWQNTIGGSEEEVARWIEQTTDGGFIVSGSSSSEISGDKTEASYGYEDMWIVKLNAAGTIQWQKALGGGDTEVGMSVKQVSGGYIAGSYSFSDSSGNKTENSNGQWDYWIIKLCSGVDFDGSISMEDTAFCLNSPAATLTGSPSGGTFSGTGVTGNTFNPATAGAGTYQITYTVNNICQNGTITQEVIVNACYVGLGSNDASLLNIYPNPTSGMLTVTGIAADARVTVLNTLGEVIYEGHTSDSSLSIDLSNQAVGIYLLKIETEGVITLRKIVRD